MLRNWNRIMRRWDVVANDYYDYAAYALTEKRLLTHLLEETNFTVCSLIPALRLPQVSRAQEEHGYHDLAAWWHARVCDSVARFTRKRTRYVTLTTMPLPEMRSRHPEAVAEALRAATPRRRAGAELRQKMLREYRRHDGEVHGEL